MADAAQSQISFQSIDRTDYKTRSQEVVEKLLREGKTKPEICRPPPSSVLSAVKSFLPAMAAADKTLDNTSAALPDPVPIDIHDTQEGEEQSDHQHIHMDLLLIPGLDGEQSKLLNMLSGASDSEEESSDDSDSDDQIPRKKDERRSPGKVLVEEMVLNSNPGVTNAGSDKENCSG